MQVLKFVLDAVRAEAFNEKRTLFLFGSYTIGKEKLFLDVAAALQKKVSFSADKDVSNLDLTMYHEQYWSVAPLQPGNCK